MRYNQGGFTVVVKSILVTLWTCICTLDMLGAQLLLYRPLVAGTVTGIILGDWKQGLIISTVLELTWLGITGTGASITIDISASSILGTAFGILSGKGLPAAIVTAIPAALIIKELGIYARKLNNRLNEKAVHYAETDNEKGIEKLHYRGLLNIMASKAIPVFLILNIIGPYSKTIFESIPEILMKGLASAAGLMPIVGFGAILGFMLDRKFWIFLVFGFIISVCFKFTSTALILSGLLASLAYIMLFCRESKSSMTLDGIRCGKLNKSTLKRTFMRLNFFQFSINFRNMQNIGYTFCMIPAIDSIYREKDERIAALQRHLEFFNTNPFFIAAILGINMALEEQYGNSGGKTISGVKNSLMGAFGGSGDSFVWYILRPIIMSISISYVLEGKIIGFAAAVIIFDLTNLIFKWYSLNSGYRFGLDYIKIRTNSLFISRFSIIGTIIGLTVIGGLIPKAVVLNFNLSDIFRYDFHQIDSVLNSMLSLLLTLFAWTQARKARSSIYVAIAVIFACIVLRILLF